MTSPWISEAIKDNPGVSAYWLQSYYDAMPLIGLPADRPFAEAYGLSSSGGWTCGGLGAFGTETTALLWPLIAPFGDFHSGKLATAVPSPNLPARAVSINKYGDCVGTYQTNDTPIYKVRAFIKRAADAGAVSLPTVFGADRSSATCINDLGTVVGGCADDTNAFQAFSWDGSSNPVLLGRLPGEITANATSINNEGTIVGVSSAQSGIWHPFIARGQGLESLGQRVFGSGVVINDAGVVAASVFFDGVTPHAAILDTSKTPWTWENIDTGPLAYKGSLVTGINSAGQVVGSWRETSLSDQQVPFLYSNGRMVNLNSLDIRWPLSPTTGDIIFGGAPYEALAIDNAGRILVNFGSASPALLSPNKPVRGKLILSYLSFLGAVTQGGGGIGILPSGPTPIDPPLPLIREERDIFVALGVRELAQLSTGVARQGLLAASHRALEQAVAAIRAMDEGEGER